MFRTKLFLVVVFRLVWKEYLLFWWKNQKEKESACYAKVYVVSVGEYVKENGNRFRVMEEWSSRWNDAQNKSKIKS